MNHSRSLVRCVDECNLPLSIVENRHFRALVQQEYDVPGRTKLRELIQELHDETFNIIYNKVREYQYISVQLDHYTATNKAPFANDCVTFINEDFKFESFSFGTFKYCEGSTAEEIYD